MSEMGTPIYPQVNSSDVVLGTADCPVTLYRPNGSTPATYNRTTGAANTVLLNTLHTNWGNNGVKAGRIVLPGGILHTVGTVIAPQRFSGMYVGVTPFNITKLANRSKCLGVSEWFMERATGASATWSPGFAMQTAGPEFQNIYFSSRYQLSGTWYGTQPSHLFYSAAYQVGSGHPGYFNGFIADSLGTGKLCFRSCAFETGIDTPVLCFGYRDSAQSDGHNQTYEADWNADHALFDFCGFWGSGSAMHSYNLQAYEFTFRNCYFEPEFGPVGEWTTLVRCYRGGGVHFSGGSITLPCRVVWVGPRGADARNFIFRDMKLDSNVIKEGRKFQFFDGSSTVSLQELQVLADGIDFSYAEFPSDSYPVFAMGENQKLRVTNSIQVPPRLFSTKSSVQTGPYGLTSQTYFTAVRVDNCRTRDGYTVYTPNYSVQYLRDAATSTGTYYELDFEDNRDLILRNYLDEEVTP